MEIRNVTQFSNWISSSGIASTDPVFQQIVKCMNNYTASCNCHKVQDKQNIYNACNKMYVDAVRIVLPRLKNTILTNVPGGKITFYLDNGSIIATVSR